MIKTKERKVIDVGDWDNLITKTYNRPYNFQQQDDCKERQQVYIKIPDHPSDFENDTIPETVNHEERGVSFEAWLARDPKQPLKGKNPQNSWSIDLWWDRNFYPDVQMVANDLHSKGLIEAGEYYINIDW